MSLISPALERDLHEVGRAFPGATTTVSPDRRLVVRATVRGTEIQVAADLHTWPTEPPEVRVVGGARLLHPLVSPGGAVRGLDCVRAWNRTFGVTTVLRELERSFLEQPPLHDPTPGDLLWRLIRGLLR